ncbi:carboxyltransferase domain-containing protein [Microbacterium sp.]|uniref:5-oxoprolinase subunit B family protein n=1 Tax=Microbacterium sp. TaxID=51671 RepID=UPI00289D911F|nr:carboxyltransferase domain-containing protein [Microbacterium sp.]
MSAFPLSIAEYGDGAVMVTVRSPEETERRHLIGELRERVLTDLPPGVEDIVSGLESLLVEFDPLVTTSEQVSFALGALGKADIVSGARPGPSSLVVPIVVNDETAPDLADVADELGLSPDEVIDLLESSTLTVNLLAAAMAPMMDGLDVPSPVRRQATPRTDVPAGSVMIAGRNAIIQPFPGPTGWRVIGRSPLRIVDITRDAPVSFAPGDRIAFRRISETEAAALDGVFLEGGVR